ncbi:MAG: IS200/IS605 family transposase [Ktedonobacteraceae bacterium]
MNIEYEHDTHNVHLIVHHIIFCPKRRRKILVGPIRERLQQIIREVAAENKWSVIELAIQPDHVHVFMRSNPRTLPTDIARLIKGRSSHLLREEYPFLKRMPSLWTRSTFYSTAGNVSSETIQQYIERQGNSSC